MANSLWHEDISCCLPLYAVSHKLFDRLQGGVLLQAPVDRWRFPPQTRRGHRPIIEFTRLHTSLQWHYSMASTGRPRFGASGTPLADSCCERNHHDQNTVVGAGSVDRGLGRRSLSALLLSHSLPLTVSSTETQDPKRDDRTQR